MERLVALPANVASILMPGIHIKYISGKEIGDNTEFFNIYWERIHPIPNIQTIHCVRGIEQNKILISVTILSQIRNMIILFDDELSADEENTFEDSEHLIDSANLLFIPDVSRSLQERK